MNEFLKRATEIEPEIIHNRRELHKIPELGFELLKTSAYVKEKLDEMGIKYRDCGVITEEEYETFLEVGFPDQRKATGIVATLGSGEPCILLRADMDALPMDELNECEYKSTHKGAMHSCGHDSHTAMLLAAAKMLKEREDELKGTVKLCFQIGEELGEGSNTMIRDGLLENPKVDVAFGLHVFSDEDAGKVLFSKGTTTSSIDEYRLKIFGKGGHSSMPQKCVDPIFIATQLSNSLYQLIGRELDPKSNASLVVGVNTGGTVVNIIPDRAEMVFSIRTYDAQSRSHLKMRIREIVDATVKMWRGEYKLTDLETASVINNKELCEELAPFIDEIVGAENTVEFDGMSGSEDFGNISERVPGMFVFIGAGKKGAYPLHNPMMTLDESVFKLGAAIHANVAMRWLEENSIEKNSK